MLLFGPSGTGKSTVLKSFYGFFPVGSGDLLFKGKLLDKRAFWEVRKEVAYVPQNLDIGEGPVRPLVEAVFSYRGNTGIRRTGNGPAFGALRARRGNSRQELRRPFRRGEAAYRYCHFPSLEQGNLFSRRDHLLPGCGSQGEGHYLLSYLENATELIISHDPEWEGRHEVRIIRFDEHSRPPEKNGEIENKESP